MIFVECNNDYDLMIYFELEYGVDFDHSYGKINVLNALLSSSKALAIVDEDPHNNNFKYQLEDYPRIDHTGNVFLYKVPNTEDQYIIEIPNELELWLESIARRLNVNPADYEITYTNGRIKKNLRKRHIPRYFEDFLERISGHDEIRTIKRWIEDYGQ